jgi:hypothetical protein
LAEIGQGGLSSGLNRKTYGEKYSQAKHNSREQLHSLQGANISHP